MQAQGYHKDVCNRKTSFDHLKTATSLDTQTQPTSGDRVSDGICGEVVMMQAGQCILQQALLLGFIGARATTSLTLLS